MVEDEFSLGIFVMLPSCCVLDRLGVHKAWSILHLNLFGSLAGLLLLAYLRWPANAATKN